MDSNPYKFRWEDPQTAVWSGYQGTLVDDGTLDTVIKVQCLVHCTPIVEERPTQGTFRFSQSEGERDFEQIMREAISSFAEQHEI